jgi:hypothetical protein
MSRENVIQVLDQIHSNRDAQLPLRERIPVYLRAATEVAKVSGLRHKSINFVGLAVKATATTAFQSGVEMLQEAEPRITSVIENTGDAIVRGLNKIGRNNG